LKKSIGAILTTALLSSFAIATQEMPKLCPIVEPAFNYLNASSNQITWQSLPFFDKTFLEQTRAPSALEKQARATGSVELLLLVKHALVTKEKMPNNPAQLRAIAQRAMKAEIDNLSDPEEVRNGILKAYIEGGRIPIDVRNHSPRSG